MPTMYTPLTDGQYGRAATFNAPLQEMETAILARYGVLRTVQEWTTLTADQTTITPTVVAGYNTLQLIMALRTDRAAQPNDSIYVRINADVSSTYVWRALKLDAATASGGGSGVNGFQLDFAATAATATTATYAYVNLRLSLASSAVARMGNFESVHQSAAGATPTAYWGTLLYPTASSIASIQVLPVNGTVFVTGSQYALYGMS